MELYLKDENCYEQQFVIQYKEEEDCYVICDDTCFDEEREMTIMYKDGSGKYVTETKQMDQGMALSYATRIRLQPY